jgi:hypothetical protein
MAKPEHVCLPINLDAFVLNQAVCDSGEARIAPIVQPNYVSLRLQNSQIQHDILPHIDLHNSRPAIANPRIAKTFSQAFKNLDVDNSSPAPTDLVSINRSRCGIYLHWTIPRGYRSGYSQAANPPQATSNSSQSSDQSKSTSKYKETTNPNPEFPRVPNRWLLVRILRDFSTETPVTVKPDTVAAWVIESDKLRKIEELDSSIDLETDVTPFVAFSGDEKTNEDILNNQAEKYIGLKVPLSEWSEKTTPGVDGKDRVPLTVMNSSNPVFADYAIHNPNVFSTKDNLQFGKDVNGNPLYLKTAVCDYIVVGWHSDMQFDPLGKIKDPNAPLDLRSRMTKLYCAAPANSDGLDDKHSKDTTTISGNQSGDITRLFCHAARYSVTFNASKPETPGDKSGKNFGDGVDMEPVAVGTSPLDAVMAFFQAHQLDEAFEEKVFGKGDEKPDKPATGSSDGKDAGKASGTDGGDKKESATVKIANTLMHLRELLYATEDDYDSRVKAADLIFAHNFARLPGGFTWHYDKKKKDNEPPPEPSADEKEALDRLNEYQRLWDAADRQLALARWALFSEFFKFVSDPSSGQPGNRDPDRLKLYTSRVPNLRNEITDLMRRQSDLQTLIDAMTVVDDKKNAGDKKADDKKADDKKADDKKADDKKADDKKADDKKADDKKADDKKSDGNVNVKKILVRKIANDSFFKRTDPTLCLAGMDGGWDPEFLDSNTPSRFLHHITRPLNAKDSLVVQNTLDLVDKKLPKDLNPTVKNLIGEASGSYPEILKLFGHKKWDAQPFSPQFVEWEGIYYHIDDKEWEIKLAPSALSSSNHTQMTYINPHQLSTLDADKNPRNDVRHISGRMLVLPQPSFALDAVVAQVLGSTPKDDLPEELKTDDQRTQFRTDVKKLKFISGQLSGFTDALVTCAIGQHVKPNVRPQAENPRPMQAAVTAAKDIGLTSLADFELMGGETGRTPYGTLTDFRNFNRQPFKAVQHGQFGKWTRNGIDVYLHISQP